MIKLGVKGPPGPPGPSSPGTPGTRGSIWSTGSGAPSAPFGLSGDQYLNTANGDVYASSGSAWTLTGNIRGAAGAAGSTGATGTRGSLWSAAAGVPSSPFGLAGDQYLNTSNGDVYISTGSSWTLTGNIRGSTGATGSTGSAGTNGTNGTNGARGSLWSTGSGAPNSPFGNSGDLYLNTANGDIYSSTGSAWSLIGNIKGTAGVNAFGSPTSRSLSLATAYQATDPSKPAFLSINLQATPSLSISGGSTNTAEIVIGSTNAVASGTGSAAGRYNNSLTGTLVVGLTINASGTATVPIALPTGWFFAIRQTSGTVSIVSVFDQSVG